MLEPMAELVALNLPGGPGYVEAIKRIWDAGNAFAPVDPRLPAAQAKKVMAALAPTAVIEAAGDGVSATEMRSVSAGQSVDAGDALVIATSGTTGEPKAVVHTHAGVLASAVATSNELGVDPTRHRWLAVLPLAHIGGLSVVLRSILTDTPVEIHSSFDTDATIDAARRGATHVSLVTRALNQVPNELFETILIGGAAPPPDRPKNVIATYGSTETGSGIVYERRALSGVDLDIADDGEVRVKGPMLFRGYSRPSDPNRPTDLPTVRAVADPFDADGWFRTGDLGHWNDDGSLMVEGRRGDVIVSGGEKVWPAPIEAFLATLDSIAEVALVGRPDPNWGHRVVAVVVPVNPAAPPLLDELRRLVSTEFASWSAPKELELRSELPKTPLGKVKRGELVTTAEVTSYR